MPNSITDVMTAAVGNVTAYHFAVASMISPWLVCRAAAWVRAEEHAGALEKSSLRHRVPLQSSAVGEGKEKARPDWTQLLLSLWVGQEGSSTYLPEPSRAFCFLLLWIPAFSFPLREKALLWGEQFVSIIWDNSRSWLSVENMPCGLRRVPAAMLGDFNRVLGIFEGLVAHSCALFLRKSLFLFNIEYKITKNV